MVSNLGMGFSVWSYMITTKDWLAYWVLCHIEMGLLHTRHGPKRSVPSVGCIIVYEVVMDASSYAAYAGGGVPQMTAWFVRCRAFASLLSPAFRYETTNDVWPCSGCKREDHHRREGSNPINDPNPSIVRLRLRLHQSQSIMSHETPTINRKANKTKTLPDLTAFHTTVGNMDLK